MPYIEESIGAPPGDIQEITSLDLIRIDGHSTLTTYRDSPLEANVDMTPGYSMERWIRLAIESPFLYVSNVRFWIPGLTLGVGWTCKYGVSATYFQPTSSQSAYALDSIPTARPVSPNIWDDTVDGPGPWVSPWIVLQASVNGDAPPGPVLGFDTGTGLPITLEYQFEWEQV